VARSDAWQADSGQVESDKENARMDDERGASEQWSAGAPQAQGGSYTSYEPGMTPPGGATGSQASSGTFGSPAQQPGKYCARCGAMIDALAEICPRCGVRQPQMVPVTTSYAPVVVVGGKSKITAALLAFFLGGLGVHRFYLGDTSLGVTMLAITLISFVLTFVIIGFFGLLAMGIWAFVDFIRYLVMSDGEFNARYNSSMPVIGGSRGPYLR